LTRSAAPIPISENGVKQRGSGSIQSKPSGHKTKAVEGLTFRAISKKMPIQGVFNEAVKR
jgi:hypothetical protein